MASSVNVHGKYFELRTLNVLVLLQLRHIYLICFFFTLILAVLPGICAVLHCLHIDRFMSISLKTKFKI